MSKVKGFYEQDLSEVLPCPVNPQFLSLSPCLSVLDDLKEKSRGGAHVLSLNAYPGVWWSGSLQRLCKLKVTG